MKKLLAIILSIAMLFGVLAINTFAETTTEPKVSVITNAGSPVAVNVPTRFTVKFDNFTTIKGVDVEISVPADLAFEEGDVTFTGFAGDPVKDQNYTLDNEAHKIRFVDLKANDATSSCKLTFGLKNTNDKLTENPTITITGSYADSGKTFYAENQIVKGAFEIAKKIDEVKTETETQANATVTLPNVTNKFIPQGSVYIYDEETKTYTFATKQEDGSFIADKATGTYTYQSFDVPENNITTFGASNEINSDTTMKFGNYYNNFAEGDNCGTMVIEGDWLELKNYYIQRGYTVQQLTKLLYDKTKNILIDENGNYKADYVAYTLNNNPINIYLFKQQKHMWRSQDNKVLEYGIRLHNVVKGQTYTGVAYFEKTANEKTTVTLSNDVKSVTR